jgi:MFS transporter, DHA1 family, inner membrane transport protein
MDLEQKSPASSRDQLPWPSLVVLGGATFVMVTGEMLPTAVLPQMSADLGVTQARTGLLVSLWALTVVVATFPLVRLTRRWDRRSVVAGALVVFAAASAVTSVAPTYEVAVGSRLLGAAVCGLLWATVNAHVADIVPSHRLAAGVAVVLGGATLGTVVGVPLASFVAQGWDWRAAFGALAVLGVAAAALVRATVVGAVAVPSAAGPDEERATASVRQLRPALVVAGLVGLVLVGHFAAFTFVTRLVADAAAALPGGVSGALLLFGASSAVGIAFVGRVRERWTGAALVAATILVAVSVLALTVVDGRPLTGVVVLVAWGLTSGVLPPLAQTIIMRTAGPEHRGTAGGVIPVVFNLGIAVGAAVGSVLVERSGPAALPVPAALVVGVAAVGLVASMRARAAGATRAAPEATPAVVSSSRALVDPATPAPCPS